MENASFFSKNIFLIVLVGIGLIALVSIWQLKKQA
jgi:hypothetical protein